MQGLGSDISTIPEVNVHIHVGDVASSSTQRVDGPADIAQDKSEKPTQPVGFDFQHRWYQQFHGLNIHGLNIQKLGYCFLFPM